MNSGIGLASRLAERVKADRRVDAVAQHGLSCLDITGKQAFDAFFEQGLAKRRIAFDSCLDCLFEISC